MLNLVIAFVCKVASAIFDTIADENVKEYFREQK